MTGSIKRKMLEVVPVVVKSEGFDFMHDERLDRRLKRRNIGTRRFKVDSNGKNKNCKGIAALKRSSEILCIQKDGHDRDVGNEDCRKYYDGSVRGLFIDSDAHLDTKSSSSKKNNAKYSDVKYNTSRSRSCILLDDDCYSYEVDEHCKKVSKDLDGGLYVDSDCDAYSDKSSSKRNTRSTDNGKVNVDLVNGFVENSIGTNGALDDGNNKYDGFVGDGAGTNEDPDYKMFLDKFRQDGKSCILEIPLTNEISITVRYHSQDGAYDGCDMEKPDTEKDCPKRQNKGTTKLLKIDSRIERMETMSDTRKERVVASRKLRGVTARAIEISEAESKKKTKYMNPISCRGDGHAGKRPSSEALCPTNCKSKHEMKLDMTQRILRDVPARVRKFSAVERNLNMETVDLTSSRANEGVSKRHSPETLSLTNFECKHKEKMEMVNHITENQIKSRAAPSRERKISAVKIPNRADGHASKKPRSQAPSSTNCKCECEMNLDMVDHSYQIFLNSLKKDGGYAAFAPQSGKGVLFGEEEQGSSDSEVIVMDKDRFFDGKDTPFVSSKAYFVEDEGWMDNGVSSKFREELLKILEKPYDEREFEDLWQRISHRSHVNRDINLRSGCIRFKTAAIGKSYLDHHADLEAKIQSAQSNQPEILNLMRGFFYWLMNASHAGSRALRPWLDSSCLKVRPRHQN
ncbi:Ribosome biogenesis protein [Salix suchowensis]|nr:Ribosome biogenesis protein [Salix suchowensis]